MLRILHALLAEAEGKKPRSATKAQLKTAFVGPTTPTPAPAVRTLPTFQRGKPDWAVWAKQILDQMRIQQDDQKHILNLLHRIDYEQSFPTKQKRSGLRRYRSLNLAHPELAPAAYRNVRPLNMLTKDQLAKAIMSFAAEYGYSEPVTGDPDWKAPSVMTPGPPPVWHSTGVLKHRIDPSAELRRAVLRIVDPVIHSKESRGLVFHRLPKEGKYTKKVGPGRFLRVSAAPRGTETTDPIKQAAEIYAKKIEDALNDPHDPAVDIGGTKYYLLTHTMKVKNPHEPTDAAGQNVYQLTIPSSFMVTTTGAGSLPTTHAVHALQDRLQTTRDYLTKFKAQLTPVARRKIKRYIAGVEKKVKAASAQELFHGSPRVSPLARPSYPKVLPYITGLASAKELVSAWSNEGLHVLATKRAGNFDEFVTQMQHDAWTTHGAKEVYGLLQRYLAEKRSASSALSSMRAKKILPGRWTPADEANEKRLWGAFFQEIKGRTEVTPELTRISRELQALYDKIGTTVKEVYALKSTEQTPNALESKYFNVERDPALATKMNWYIWLLGSENAYGIRVEERKGLRGEHIAKIQTISGKPGQHIVRGPDDASPIRIARTGRPSYDMETLKSVGISHHNLDVLHRVVGGAQRFKGSITAGTSAIWTVQTGDLYRFGLDPANMAQYLQESKKQRTAFSTSINVFGLLGDQRVVRKSIPDCPMFQFRIPDSPYEFALIPAVNYLMYFDSPLHSGSRLVHGRVLPQKTTPLDQPPTLPVHVSHARQFARERFGHSIQQQAREMAVLRQNLAAQFPTPPPPVAPPRPPSPPFLSHAANFQLKKELQLPVRGNAPISRGLITAIPSHRIIQRGTLKPLDPAIRTLLARRRQQKSEREA